MTSVRAVVGSDTPVTSPRFVDAAEVPTACDATPTVAASSAAGATLATLTASAVEGQAGAYTTTLTADSHLTAPDVLTLTWTGIVGGADRVLSQVLEVAAGVYVPTHELLEQRTMGDAGAAAERVRQWRDAFEAIAEEARGTAYVRRLAVETHRGRSSVLVHRAHPDTVRSVTIAGTAQDASEFTIGHEGLLLQNGARCVVAEADTVVVAYEHGYTVPPPAIVQACREYVRAKILADTSDQGRNVISFTNLATGEQYRYGTADWSAGRFTGMESVDALIRSVPDERFPSVA